MATINPYLNFDGTAEKAFKFYQSIFGGELYIQKMKDVPGFDNEKEGDRVMHVALPIGNNVLMASDILQSQGHELSIGNHSYISYSPDSREEADKIFKALSEGGEVEMPMDDMFWGDYYGSLVDKFGIRWMINYNPKK